MKFKPNNVYNHDCIEGMKKLADGSVDLVFADPPFNIGYKYDQYDDRRASDEYLDWSRQWMAEAVRALKDDGTLWLAIGDEYAADLKVILQRELGLFSRSWVIWYYTFGVHCKYKFARSHTHLLYMTKDQEKFTFNMDDPKARVPSARQLVYADKRANPKGKLPDDTWILRPDTDEADEERIDRLPPGSWVLRPQDCLDHGGFEPSDDVWYFPRVCGTFKERSGWHGCQMPEQLLARIIRLCSNENELVLDPFGGSGTTPAVAKKLNREFLAFELSDDYHARIQERLAEIKPGDPLDGTADPLKSAPKTAHGRKLSDFQKKKKKATKKKTVKKAKKKATKKSKQRDDDSPGPLFDKTKV
jgi:DNA modification methylase